ncbi:Tyrosine-protein phosphatase yvh1 [Termitomyces sp. J132]|nr:Tyrosine-protein phosphatase yvh1 [Termitomyces sp. J132]
MPSCGIPSVNEIVKDQIYLGNCTITGNIEENWNDTYLVSVNDSEYDNILTHLPKTCNFIETALKNNGKVLVHCVMGISRSATVVAAYLMKTRKISRATAIKYIKQRRPEIHPNYGFIKQLEAFAECQYDPCPTNPAYCRWKRHHKRNVTQYLNQMVDTTIILPDKLLLSSEFPNDICQAESLILDAGITHILSISPTKLPSAALTYLQKHQHINLTDRRGELLLVLPDVCLFLKEAIESGGQVLVHSLIETTACIVVCAFLMFANGLSDKEALTKLHQALPLFNPTKSFFRHLELFKDCHYSPTLQNPLVLEWVNSGTFPTSRPKVGLATDLKGIAAEIMSETGFDMSAFGKALASIQRRVDLD